MFDATLESREGDGGVFELLFEDFFYFVDVVLFDANGFFSKFLGPVVFFWKDVFEGEVFELGFEFVQTKAVGDRGVDFEGFEGDAASFFFGEGIECHEVVDAVSKFNDDNSDVRGHSDEHFAEVFDIAIDTTVFEFTEFGDATDHVSNILAEVVADVVESDFCVFWDVMKETGDDDGDWELGVSEDFGGGKGVGDVGNARSAALTFVGLFGKAKSKLEDIEIGIRLVGADFFEESSWGNGGCTGVRLV